MSRFFSAALGALLLQLAACSDAPRSFELVSLEEARTLLARGQLTMVEARPMGSAALNPIPGAIRWPLPETPSIPRLPAGLPAGGVLVIASGERDAHRSAAALSRAGNQPVYACIAATAEARSSLYSVALKTRENAADGDS